MSGQVRCNRVWTLVLSAVVVAETAAPE